jgi:hypothetical protein
MLIKSRIRSNLARNLLLILIEDLFIGDFISIFSNFKSWKFIVTRGMTSKFIKDFKEPINLYKKIINSFINRY